MKKAVAILISCLVLVGCGNSTSASMDIKIYTRDSSSGTREAFEAIIGLDDDALTANSSETTSNGDMASQVGKDTNGIGYVSLSTDFEANSLKALTYEGVEATVETVNSGEYKLARPFEYVTRASGDFDSDTKEQLVLAFIDYLSNSTEGLQAVLSAGGIVDVSQAKPWSTLKANHPVVNQDNSSITIKTGGSTSVAKTLEAAMQSFIPLAGNFKFEPNQTGSSDGYKRVLGTEKDGANAVDIGFASREFKSEEDTTRSIAAGQYAKDAVVVVVNVANEAITDLNAEKLVQIFSGEITTWDGIK